MFIDATVGGIAAEQLGLITRGQAIAAGLTDSQIKHRVRSGKWLRRRTGVFAVAGAPTGWEQTVLAGVLAAGEGTVASHLCAAVLHEYPDPMRALPEVSVRPGRNPKTKGLRVHRPGLLPECDVTMVGCIPTTSYARTLVDCTGRLSLGQVARALDAGLVQSKVTVGSVQRCLAALGQGPGRHPSTLWTLIAERGTDVIKSESRPEMRMLRVLNDGGLPKPMQQHWVTVGGQSYRLDLAYPECKVALECDGWDTHRSRSSFDSDRRRDRLLQLDGWVVLRVTSQTSDREIVDSIRPFVQ